MKRTCFILFFFLSLTAFTASAQDYILMPENFIMHKGDTLKLHLLNVSQFNKQDEFRYDGSNTTKFIFSNGSKKIMNLMTTAKDSAMPIVSFKVENEGLNMIDMTRKSITDDIDRDDFLKILDDEALTQYSEKAKNGSKDSFREKYTWYLKSLVEVEKNSANDFEKPLKDEFEIILKDNPYKGNYGDDIIALINFKGKPSINTVVTLYIKTATGNVFAQKLSSDKQGQVYFKLSREGIYYLRTLYMEPSKDKTADFETWIASYTFAFSSSNEMPNTYREFGFGNKH